MTRRVLARVPVVIKRAQRGALWFGGRYVAAAALRIAFWASSMSSSTVVSISDSAPLAPTAMASAAAAALSGASSRKTPSNSPKAYQKPRSLQPRDSATSRAAALLSCGWSTQRLDGVRRVAEAGEVKRQGSSSIRREGDRKKRSSRIAGRVRKATRSAPLGTASISAAFGLGAGDRGAIGGSPSMVDSAGFSISAACRRAAMTAATSAIASSAAALAVAGVPLSPVRLSSTSRPNDPRAGSRASRAITSAPAGRAWRAARRPGTSSAR